MSDEHLFPEGSGGDIILPAASCPACRNATSLFEQRCLRGYFGTARAHLQLYGKRRPNRRPTAFPVFNIEENSTEMVPIAEYPFSFARLELAPPGILTGRERAPEGELATDFNFRPVTLSSAVEATAAFVREHPGEALRLDIPITEFYRLLAKVGHAFTAANLGLDGFTPALTELIRNEAVSLAEATYLIGGAFEFGHRVEAIDNSVYAHQVTLLRAYARERKWLVIRTQLFAPLGAVYDVFTGWLND